MPPLAFRSLASLALVLLAASAGCARRVETAPIPDAPAAQTPTPDQPAAPAAPTPREPALTTPAISLNRQDTPSPVPSTSATQRLPKPGFAVREHKGRTWVFYEGSKELEKFDAGAVPPDHATRLSNVDGKISKLYGPSSDTIRAYVDSPFGFVIRHDKGMPWVFRAGSKPLALVMAGGEIEASVTRLRSTDAGVIKFRAPDADTLDAFFACRPGFVLLNTPTATWVFLEEHPELRYALKGEFPESHISRLRVVDGKEVLFKAPDALTLDLYTNLR
jgi:hypothetical protein